MTHGEEQLDPHLRDLFEQLRRTPQRAPQRVTRGRADFLRLAKSLGQPVSPRPIRRLMGWIGVVDMISRKESYSMTKVVAVLLSLVLFIGSGAGLTTFASQGALPGETLYGVKTGLEGLRLALSSSSTGDFELHLSYAAQRVEEIKLLAANGQYEDVDAAVDSLDHHLEEAAEALSALAESDPVLAAELAARYERLVTGSIQDLTAAGDPALEDALDVLADALEDLHDDIDEPDDDSDDPDDDDINEPDDENDSDDLDENDIDEPDDDDDSDGLDDDDIDETDDEKDDHDLDDDDDSDDLDDDDIDEPDDEKDSDDLDDDNMQEPDDDDDSDDLDDDDIDEPEDDDDSDDLDDDDDIEEPDDD
ncbi:MAG: hypothetical protein GTO63_20345 [Anaerolineae bacterium]|nr:hypothetical protein [Anaerolineae bacterium]NIN97125.1 hypothetical protein [Anaerolineae bacterium]NIQ80098.1 hypothetical protein [Anaerolineae bacterium]